jgi:hypothetical protein
MFSRKIIYKQVWWAGRQLHSCVNERLNILVHIAEACVVRSVHIPVQVHSLSSPLFGKLSSSATKEFNYRSLFVTCVRHRRHFHRLLQRCYLSDNRVLNTHVCNKHQSCYVSIFTCYLYSGMRKKWGALICEQPSHHTCGGLTRWN